MKRNIWSILFLTNILVGICSLQADGFVAGTLVHTQHECIPIEQCKIGDVVLARDRDGFRNDFITQINQFCANSLVKINTEGECLHTSQNQRFYVINKKEWVRACELQPFDMLLCMGREFVFVFHVAAIAVGKQKIFALSVEPNHTFCVGMHAIVAHNMEPASATTMVVTLSTLCPPAATIVAVAEAVTLGISGFIMYRAHKKSEKNKKNDGCFSEWSSEDVPKNKSCYPSYPVAIDPVIGCGKVENPINTIEIIPYMQLEDINDSCNFPIEVVEQSVFCATVTLDEGKDNRQYGGPWYNRTEDWINEHPFGKKIRSSLIRSDFTNQGKRAFKVVKKIENCDGFNKGDYLVIDALHQDHLEIFGANHKWKHVANFDGTKNEKKTEQGKKELRRPLE
jgi:hypothetical protein